ncbi:MAG: 50S ribosomal protein L10 [Bifidobacteriaceae bacterium]|jgi:large subunit ribosomal protein L10|nr:50S ribosomal protein L10 [Bifidobacteriaceae bacterium]
MARPDKVAAVAELVEAFNGSTAAVLTEYRGLTVGQLKELRTALRDNATYAVVKNTLARIAVREAGIDGVADALEGPTAIAFVTGDPVAVAKQLRDFARVHHNLVVKAGVLEGAALDQQGVVKLADMDSREVTLAKVAGVLKASLYKSAYMFTAPAGKAVRTIDALREKQESAA